MVVRYLILLYVVLCRLGIAYSWCSQAKLVSRTSSLWMSSQDLEIVSGKGKIYMVGAGPGDPDLLTVQAHRLLKEAELVVADRLVSPEILSLITCDIKIARKRPGCAEDAQREIYKWVKDGVNKGKTVVRLKIGDPFLFGRGGEEYLYFRNKLQVTPIVATGISSSFSAPLSASIPLTHRGTSNQVLICTGYGKDSSDTTMSFPRYDKDRTLVLLMAVGRIAEITKTLMSELGYPVNVPVAIIENATTPKQRLIPGRLNNIAILAKQRGARAPAVIVVGYVCQALD